MFKLKGVFKPLKCKFIYGMGSFIWCSRPCPIQIVTRDVMWKDKFNSPRHEGPPYIWIHLFGLDFSWYWDLPRDIEGHEMDYWEQALWYLYYSDKDIKKAEETWPWTTFDNKESTWNKDFLI